MFFSLFLLETTLSRQSEASICLGGIRIVEQEWKEKESYNLASDLENWIFKYAVRFKSRILLEENGFLNSFIFLFNLSRQELTQSQRIFHDEDAYPSHLSQRQRGLVIQEVKGPILAASDTKRVREKRSKIGEKCVPLWGKFES